MRTIMKSLCGADCSICGYGECNNCKGCVESSGCPFGEKCFIHDYIKLSGMENYQKFKKQLIDEFNSLNIPGMSAINELYAMNGAYVNLAYHMPSGYEMKFLNDNSIYLCNQVECDFGGDRCYGLVAGMDFLLVSVYGENGSNPEIVIYKKR